MGAGSTSWWSSGSCPKISVEGVRLSLLASGEMAVVESTGEEPIVLLDAVLHPW
jgi:hypothetical protein